MPVREGLNKYPRTTVIGTAIVLVACLSIAWSRLHQGGIPMGQAKSFYTTDDSSPAAAMGALFEGDWDLWPPFDHGGKPAYRALVFSADGGSTEFIGYLEKLSPEGKQMIEEMQSNSAGKDPDKLRKAEYNIAQFHTLVKKPGVGDWVEEGQSAESRAAMKLNAPAGQDPANLESVFP